MFHVECESHLSGLKNEQICYCRCRSAQCRSSARIFTFLAKFLFQEVKFWVCFNVGSRKYKIWQNCSVWGSPLLPLSYEWPVVTHRFSAATTSATSSARPRLPVPRPHSPSRCCFCYAFLLLTSDGYLLYIIVNCIQTNWTINCHINWTASSLCSRCIKFPEFQVTPGNSQTGIVSICVIILSHKNLDILFTLFCLWIIDNCLLQFEHC